MASPPALAPLPPPPSLEPKVCTDPVSPPHAAPDRPTPDARQLELLIYNGAPFHDHWAYFVQRDAGSPSVGVKTHATGDVRSGFAFEIKRAVDLESREEAPSRRIPLQWLDAVHFDEVMWNDGVYKVDAQPACGLETELSRVKVPGKTLRSAEESDSRKITQRDCQTWIVESADHLANRGILNPSVAKYLHSIKQ